MVDATVSASVFRLTRHQLYILAGVMTNPGKSTENLQKKLKAFAAQNGVDGLVRVSSFAPAFLEDMEGLIELGLIENQSASRRAKYYLTEVGGTIMAHVISEYGYNFATWPIEVDITL